MFVAKLMTLNSNRSAEVCWTLNEYEQIVGIESLLCVALTACNIPCSYSCMCEYYRTKRLNDSQQ